MVRILILSVMLLGTALAGMTPATAGEGELAAFREPDAMLAPRLALPEVFRRDQRDQIPSRMNAPIIRGQSPSTFETPPLMAPSNNAVPYNGGLTQDPFIYGPDPVLGNPPGSVLSGVNGPQPYNFGFTPRFDYTYLGQSGTSNPDVGHFESNGIDAELAYTTPLPTSWVFTSTPQFGMRWWEGPSAIDLPARVYRLGWDFTLASPQQGPWSMQLDFNPSINTDFENSLSGDAWNLDGNAMLFYRSSPQWMFVLGAGYWDRVNGLVIPYAGVVWNPNDRWELRLLSPKSRISYFLGNIGSAAHWLYATGEYHAESYQIDSPGIGRNQVQMTDWRLALGLRSDHGWYDKFFEVGYVLGRDVEFRRALPDFEINDTLMLRYGVRY